MDEDEEYETMKVNYASFAGGFGIFTLGIFFLFLCRPYVYDYTNKDLFLPFAILVIIAGSIILLIFGIRIGQDWIDSTDFLKLNEQKPLMQGPVDTAKLPQATPQPSLMTGAYSGYVPSSPI